MVRTAHARHQAARMFRAGAAILAIVIGAAALQVVVDHRAADAVAQAPQVVGASR